MHTRPPTLRLHAGGLFTVHWGGRDFYFSGDKRESERLFLDPDSDHPGSFRRYQQWRQVRDLARPRVAVVERLTVAETVLRFLASYSALRRVRAERYYRSTLRRFVRTVGSLYTDEVDERLIDAFATDLGKLKLAPKTISHEVKAIKTLWAWASDPKKQYCRPLQLKGIKGPRVRKSRPQPYTQARVREIVRTLEKTNRPLAVWAACSYFGALRPSEAARLAHGQGRWVDIPPDDHGPAIPNGVLVLDRHKSEDEEGTPREVPVSDEARPWFLALAPLPTGRRGRTVMRREDDAHLLHLQNGYARACRLAGFAKLPSRLRDSAATHLLAAGVGEAAVDRILGHAPRSELPRYGRSALRLLRESAARLTLR